MEVKVGENEGYGLPEPSFGDREASLLVIDVDFQPAGVFGRLVTRLFFPSTHLPSLRRTSIRSKRLRTLRLAPLFVDFP